MRNDSLEKYKVNKKWSKERSFKVTNSYKTIDYYKYYKDSVEKKKGYKLNIFQFSKILQLIGRKLAEEYLRTGQIEFPYKMGSIILYKVIRAPYIKDGKLVVNNPVNWNETLNLWFEDKEAEKNKTLIRHEKKEIFKTKYSSFGAHHKNKSYYDFKIVRSLQKRIGELAEENKLEAFKAF